MILILALSVYLIFDEWKALREYKKFMRIYWNGTDDKMTEEKVKAIAKQVVKEERDRLIRNIAKLARIRNNRLNSTLIDLYKIISGDFTDFGIVDVIEGEEKQ